MDCLFCKIIAGQVPATKVYEDDGVVAFLDIHPINPGHTLVVPKEHAENFSVTDPALFPAIFTAVQNVAEAAMKATGAPAYNIGINTGPEAGQVVMHLHVHVMPRFEDDGYKHWGKKEVPQEEMERVARMMREELESEIAAEKTEE